MKTVYFTGSYGISEQPTVAMLEFDDETGTIRKLSEVSGIANSSYLAYRNGKLLAIVESGADSMLAAVEVSGNTFRHPKLIPFEGVDSCHISLSPVSGEIVVADYSSGDVVIFNDDKEFSEGKGYTVRFEGSGPDERRQKSPHAHCALFSHDGSKIYVCDLGSDRIHILAKEGSRFRHTHSVAAAPGYGPRMIVLNDDGTRGYVICELSGKVLVLDLEGDAPAVIQEIVADRWESRGAGDVRLSPDGRHLYASVRLAHDGIAIFSVEPHTGLLSYVGYVSTGIHPRNFHITPDGNHLLVACRDANAVEVYRRDTATGMLTKQSECAGLPKVVCITK